VPLELAVARRRSRWDCAGVGVFVVASAGLVLAATALSLPAPLRASRPTEPRAE